MDLFCTRPGCARLNPFPDLDNRNTLQTVQQKFCTSCRMPLILAGRYLPVKLLGQGGFGAAYLALDRFTPTMRFCVVKQFQPSGNLSTAQLDLALSLFEREAIVLEKLGNRHDQIPDLYAYFPLVVDNPRTGQADQFFYLVQEFINGQDLEKQVESQGPLPESEVQKVFIEMLHILDFVHEKGTIHRDIKPSNLIRDKEGQLFLLDFGAVKEIANVGAGSQQSTGIYSMGFAPPEQMAGGQVFPATDLYALAVTCLYLLTGKTAEDLYDAYHNEWRWRAHCVPSASPGLKVSDKFAQILDRLLAPTPKDRYPSAQAVLSALQSGSPPLQVKQVKPAKPSPAATQIQATPAPAPLTPPPTPPGTLAQTVQQLPLGRVLVQTALTGFLAGLWGLALASILPAGGLMAGLWGMALGGLIFAQLKRWLERTDLLVAAGATIAAFWFVPMVRQYALVTSLGSALQLPSFATAMILGIGSALGAIAVVSLFLLILKSLFALAGKI